MRKKTVFQLTQKVNSRFDFQLEALTPGVLQDRDQQNRAAVIFLQHLLGAGNRGIGIVAEGDLDRAAAADFDLGDVLAADVGGSREAGLRVARRETRVILVKLTRGDLGAADELQALGNLAADHVVLIGRDRNCSKDADDRHDDHQLDERKSLLPMFHDRGPLIPATLPAVWQARIGASTH